MPTLAHLVPALSGAGAQACVECGRPIVFLQARTPYEALVRARQVHHKLCERCARTAVEVGSDLDGLHRKRRFLQY